MKVCNYIVREIKHDDNLQVCSVIQEVFIELKLPLKGTAYADEETKIMYESYLGKRKKYFVIELNGKIYGGGGINQLIKGNSKICELQKMYFVNSIRGKGLGKILLQKCLDFAKQSEFKTCYLETIKQLKSAVFLYQNFGFKKISNPLGNTSHYSCDVYMIKKL